VAQLTIAVTAEAAPELIRWLKGNGATDITAQDDPVDGFAADYHLVQAQVPEDRADQLTALLERMGATATVTREDPEP
jgi:hypothetical protein